MKNILIGNEICTTFDEFKELVQSKEFEMAYRNIIESKSTPVQKSGEEVEILFNNPNGMIIYCNSYNLLELNKAQLYLKVELPIELNEQQRKTFDIIKESQLCQKTQFAFYDYENAKIFLSVEVWRNFKEICEMLLKNFVILKEDITTHEKFEILNSVEIKKTELLGEKESKIKKNKIVKLKTANVKY